MKTAVVRWNHGRFHASALQRLCGRSFPRHQHSEQRFLFGQTPAVPAEHFTPLVRRQSPRIRDAGALRQLPKEMPLAIGRITPKWALHRQPHQHGAVVNLDTQPYAPCSSGGTAQHCHLRTAAADSGQVARVARLANVTTEEDALHDMTCSEYSDARPRPFLARRIPRRRLLNVTQGPRRQTLHLGLPFRRTLLPECVRASLRRGICS